MNRHKFYLVLAGLGLLSGVGQWVMFRYAAEILNGMGGLIFFLILPFIFVFPRLFEEHLPRQISRICALIGGYWFVFAIYATMLLIPFVVVGLLLNLLGEVELWQTFATVYARGVLCLLVIVLYAGYQRATHPVHRDVTIQTDKIGQDLTVAFASDIHFGLILGRKFAANLVQEVNRIHPDVFLIGGDIIDGNLEFVLREGTFSAFSSLDRSFASYAVLGNHDYYGQDIELEAKRLAENHILPLLGKTVQVADGVEVTGVRDALFDFPQLDHLAKAREDCFSIFMEHEPMHIQAAADAGYDLYLAGHTHAGQFWPVCHFTKKMFALDYGAEEFGQMTAIVTSGYGSWGALFRTGPAPEIVIIHLKKA